MNSSASDYPDIAEIRRNAAGRLHIPHHKVMPILDRIETLESALRIALSHWRMYAEEYTGDDGDGRELVTEQSPEGSLWRAVRDNLPSPNREIGNGLVFRSIEGLRCAAQRYDFAMRLAEWCERERNRAPWRWKLAKAVPALSDAERSEYELNRVTWETAMEMAAAAASELRTLAGASPELECKVCGKPIEAGDTCAVHAASVNAQEAAE